MAWEIILVPEVEEWFLGLNVPSKRQLTSAIDQLRDFGPALGRPLVDRIHESQLHNLKELRPGSSGRSELRILFIFDPARRAVLLVAGDKAGRWRQWYVEAVKLAEQRYARYLGTPPEEDT